MCSTTRSFPLTAVSGQTRPGAFRQESEERSEERPASSSVIFPGKAVFQCFSQPEELEAGLREAASVDVATWQHYLGCGLVDARRSHDNLGVLCEQGWLRIYVMYVDQFPVAFLIGQHYKQTFYCQHAGYHPDFSRFSVGSLLTAWVLESLAADGVEQVDLGEGSQEHNRRLGCRIYEEGTVHVYCSHVARLVPEYAFRSDPDDSGNWKRKHNETAPEQGKQGLVAILDLAVEGQKARR